MTYPLPLRIKPGYGWKLTLLLVSGKLTVFNLKFRLTEPTLHPVDSTASEFPKDDLALAGSIERLPEKVSIAFARRDLATGFV
ncbi:MAG: hypothetical protein CMF59_18040 [Leptospiraceae bacterium]|nr:hypothetical protein [Leptospiraceae bacterium]